MCEHYTRRQKGDFSGNFLFVFVTTMNNLYFNSKSWKILAAIMAAKNLNKSRKRKITQSDEVQAKKAKENSDNSSESIELDNEVNFFYSYMNFYYWVYIIFKSVEKYIYL